MTPAAEPSGVLVVRAWYDGDPPLLKARITHTIEVVERHSVTATTATVAEIHAELDRWLDALENSAGR